MEKIRKGNDIIIQWEIVTGTEGNYSPYDLTGRDLTLYLTSPYGREKVEGFSTDGNLLQWRFFGKDQQYTGVYTLTLVENDGTNDMHTVDECYAFDLVQCSCMEGSSMIAHTVRLNSSFSAVKITFDTDAYLSEESANAVENRVVTRALNEKANAIDLENAQAEFNSRLNTQDATIESRLSEQDATIASVFAAQDEKIESRLTEQDTFLSSSISRQDVAIDRKFKLQDSLIDERIDEQDLVIVNNNNAQLEIINDKFEDKESEIDAYVDEKIADQNEYIQQQISEQDATISTAVEGLADSVAEQNTIISNAVSNLNNSISEQNTTISDAVTNLDNAIAEQNTTITERFDEQDAQIAKKVSDDGKYPDLTSGFADNLVGRGESVPAEFSFRATGGKSILDGTARIKELRGNAVVWNQQLHITSSGQYQSNGVTFDVAAELGEVVANGSASTADAIRGVPIPNTIAGHRYFFFGCPNGGSASSYYITDQAKAFDYGGGDIYTARETGLTFVVITIVKGTSVNNLKFYPKAIDLTQMFGAGKEPSTIEEFYSRCPLGVDMNAYNEGEMIADNSTAIKSIGDNAWDEQWENGTFDITTGADIVMTNQIRSKNLIKILPSNTYFGHIPTNSKMWIIFYDEQGNVISRPSHSGVAAGNSVSIDDSYKTFTTPSNATYMRFYMTAEYGTTYKNDITISLYHSGWKAEVDNVYKPYVEDTREIDQRILDAFPNGRKPWDKVYNKNGKGYTFKGTKGVDLGSLNWVMSGVYANTFYVLPLIGAALNGDCICAKYTKGSMGVDGEIAILSNGGVAQLYITDSSYTDAASFKTAMQGVTLWYKLAEPEIIEYDEPFNLDYEVWDFGTEQAIADTPSAPINANIIYQFNAVDMIRDHEARIAELEALIASLTNGGQ